MRITLESNEAIAELEYEGIKIPARIWKGTTEGGVEVHAFILMLGVNREADVAAFERELVEIPTPTVQ